MFLRVVDKPKGKYLTIVEKYRDKSSKYPKERIVSTIGYLDQYTDKYKDPIAHFKSVAEKMTKENAKQNISTIKINTDEKMNVNEDSVKNIGYVILKRLYLELEIDKFWKSVASEYQLQYDLEKIFRLMVFSRILFPASKKKTFENRSAFFESFDGFELEDVYRALTVFGEHDEELQKWIYDHSVTKYQRDLSVGYFDCTNYYYDISKPDMDVYDDEGNLVLKKYRKYGPEKNHRKDPIVELGLLMDKTGIPLSYNIFPGNESEKVHMLPIINRTRIQYGLGRMIVVADRGLNTSDNIYMLNGKNDRDDNPRDGYVYGQSVRGADAEFKKWVLNESDYVRTRIKDTEDNDDDNDEDTLSDGIFVHKSRIYPKKIYITRENRSGKTCKQSITVDQKQMVYFSKKYQAKQRLERARAVERSKDLIDHPKKYDKVSAKGASGYVMNLSFSKDGEVIEKNLKLDEERIAEEEKYDGYYSIVTSELKMSDVEIREVYRGLTHIEDTFKVTKSEFDTRPIFVWTNDHIEGHFTTCFTAIVLIRLLQSKLDNKYTVGSILTALKKYTCANIDKNHYQFFYYDEVLEDMGKAFNVSLSQKYRTTNDIRRLLKY